MSPFLGLPPPFRIHRFEVPGLVGVMIFNDLGPLASFRISSSPITETLSILDGDGNLFRRFAALVLSIDQFDLLGARFLLENGAESLLERRLEDIEFIRIDSTLNNHFPEPVRTCDQDGIPETGLPCRSRR